MGSFSDVWLYPNGYRVPLRAGTVRLPSSINIPDASHRTMSHVRVIGLRGSFSFEEADAHFASLGADAVLLDPSVVCGEDHVRSAVMHAEKAFEEGRNRSRRVVTEAVLYAACERQIRRALDLMKPRPGSGGMVAAVIGYNGDLHLEKLGATEDPSLMEPSEEKARKLGIELFDGVSIEDAVLEQVASVDLMKQ